MFHVKRAVAEPLPHVRSHTIRTWVRGRAVAGGSPGAVGVGHPEKDGGPG